VHLHVFPGAFLLELLAELGELEFLCFNPDAQGLDQLVAIVEGG
jgi:hypothetical protein